LKTIEELLAQDIVRFLDEHNNKPMDRRKMIRDEEQSIFALQKDYPKDVQKALEKDDLIQAKKIFDELKDKYAKIPYHDANKKKTFTILEEVHAQIKVYLQKRQQEKNIYQEVQEFESQTLPEFAPVDISVNRIKSLLLKNDVLAAKKEAVQLIAVYNGLPGNQRTPSMYKKIKDIIMQVEHG